MMNNLVFGVICSDMNCYVESYCALLQQMIQSTSLRSMKTDPSRGHVFIIFEMLLLQQIE